MGLILTCCWLVRLSFSVKTFSCVSTVALRVAPVAEFFGHVADARKLYRSLAVSGRIHTFFELAQGYFARGIACRLKETARANLAQRELDAHAHALAGNLLSLLKWWLDRGTKKPPHAMDELFHRIVWHGVQQRTSYSTTIKRG